MVTRRALGVAAALAAAAALGLAAAVVTSAAAHVGGKAATSASASFSDPAGDANGAADITAVAVSDDPASGIVQFTLAANGEMAIDLALAPELNVYVDTDRNPATGSPAGAEFPGSPSGADYRLFYERTTVNSDAGFESWNGTSWPDLPQSPTMSFSRDGDTFTWRLSRSDLGTAGGFDFYVCAEIFVGRLAVLVGLDRAPEGGVWPYALSSPITTTTAVKTAVKPLIGAPTTTPRKAAAGKRFTVVFPVTRSDTGAPLTSGKMICGPSVQGKVISHAESFKNGNARLAFTIPKNAKGKLLKVKLTIEYGGKSTTKVSTFHVG
jgi:hypothetical protein